MFAPLVFLTKLCEKDRLHFIIEKVEIDMPNSLSPFISYSLNINSQIKKS